MLLRGLARRHRLVGIFVFEFVEREAAGLGDLDRALDRVGKVRKQPRHLLRRLEMPLGIGREPEAGFGDGAFLADAGEDVGERPALRHVIMHIVDGDERRAACVAEFIEQAEPARLVAAIAMHAGEEGAAGRRSRERGKPLGKSRTTVPPAAAR